MNTRIEILRDGVWHALELANKKAIEYNAIINSIGKIATREISHTNTFSIPKIQTNIRALGINVYNQTYLAKSLNQKYPANYFVEDKIVRTGFLVINNTKGDFININFIDSALDLIDKWGSITYKQLLKDTVVDIPSDYQAAIEELVDYDMDVNGILTPLSQVGTRGYNLCLFPNNLNSIGDAFQLDENEVRHLDKFNPYQSRPVWNVKAMFDLATESYGYTPIYDDSVDWDYVATQYIVEEGQDKNEQGVTGLQTVSYPAVGPSTMYQNEVPGFFAVMQFYQYSSLLLYPGVIALKPSNIPGWVDPLWLKYSWSWTFPGTNLTPWMMQNCVLRLDVSEGNVGEFVAKFTTGAGGIARVTYSNVWESPADDYDRVIHDTGIVFNNDPLDLTGQTFITDLVLTPASSIRDEVEITFDKSHLNTAIAGPIGTTFVSSDVADFTTSNISVTPSSDNGLRIAKTTSGFGTTTGTFATPSLTMGTTYQINFQVEQGSITGDLNIEFLNGGSQSLGITGYGLYSVSYTPTSGNVNTFTLSGDFEGTITKFYIHEQGLCENYIGTLISYGRGLAPNSAGTLSTIQITEEFLPPEVIVFDEFGQYLPSQPDLRHAAPRKTVKELLSAYMHKDGILMDINAKEKTVKFFNYGEYEANKIAEEYIDLSKYHLKYGNIEFNTDYGNDFAKLNRIGLNSPYPGNTYDFTLDNQGEESKFKDFTTNNNKLYKDVEQVDSIPNLITPYFEYTNQGLGLVEYTHNLGALNQVRADGTDHGSFTGLAALANVNFASLPSGTQYWYDLVDKGVRASAQFLIPVDVMSNLDMSKPIYVEELGGYYIIEKVEQYVNAHIPVTLKLIKLIDDLRRFEESPPVFNTPTISISASSLEPTGWDSFVYQIITATNFNNYTPTSATLEYRKLNDFSPEDGYTGDVVDYDFDFSTGVYQNVSHSLNSSLPITDFETGRYEIQVTDNTTGLQSNIVYGTLGDLSVLQPLLGSFIATSATPTFGLASGTFRATSNYINHVPVTSTISYRKREFIITSGDGWLGDLYIIDLMTSTDATADYNGDGDLVSHTIEITPTDGAGFYVITQQTDQATAPNSTLGGYFI